MRLKSVNPKNGELVREFDPATDQSIEQALEAAEHAFRAHKRASFNERASRLRALADRLEEDCQAHARLLTDEMGKTLAAARAEVEKCAWVCRHYADNAEAMLADVELESDAELSAVMHLPIGPVLAVMPWNFPFWQVFRAAAPAVMAGNVVLLKHASNVPRTALALQSLFESAFAPGVFQSLLIGPDRVERLLADRRVKAATVTGSTRAGSSVAEIAGKHLKKTVLELGGSDPFIVMPSADLEQALDTAVTARMLNNGQSCIAAKRFIVHADVFDRFVGGFVERFEALKVGDPLEESTDMGPMAMDRLRRRLESQVDRLLELGAERLAGAVPMDGEGYFFRPGILSGIDPNAPAFDEELFGPVAWVLRAESFDRALALANQTQYGLGSSLWTQDANEINRAFREVESGATFVNSLVKSDPRLPFGGIKQSGYGRELARDGIIEFVNRKTVVVG
ncbi:MAG TPA: NAD-dependent succinate-semialdehyde dehydrogenase [Gammaproteobacteria bacterium]|nr:NAD-dependent succinate-semialdehyde dehydrogenase [Gammaproteobacteria bacterium]